MLSADSSLIISGYGSDSGEACAHSLKEAGANKVTIAHFSELVSGEIDLKDFNFLILPGGAIDGDHLGAAQAASQRWKLKKDSKGITPLEKILKFIEAGGLVLGIGNGFQLLVKLGILPKATNKAQTASMAMNSSGKFESRWCRVAIDKESPCIYTRGITDIYLPVRHQEGKFIANNEQTFLDLKENKLIPIYYSKDENKYTEEYPYNPSGSHEGLAGICDKSGKVFGLMPHPEDHNHPTNHPRWTRGEKSTSGIEIFANAIKYINKELVARPN